MTLSLMLPVIHGECLSTTTSVVGVSNNGEDD